MSNSPHERRKLDSAPIPSTDVASVLLAAPLQIGQAEALPVRDGVNGPELEHQAEEPIITTLSNGVVDDHKEDGEEAPFDEEEHEEKLKIWDIFAEEYHDVVNELPLEYHRNFAQLEELEESQQSETEIMKATLLAYLHSIVTPATSPSPALPIQATSNEKGKGKATEAAVISSAQREQDAEELGQVKISDEKRRLLKEMVRASRSAIRSGEDKVGVCAGMYESVDRHILRLDASLAQSADLLLRNANKPAKKSRRHPEEHASRPSHKAMKKEQELEAIEKAERIDPNEPTYCLCQRVSFGQMIGCENEHCLREWFHLECVQLTSPPLGKWYCDECTSLGKNLV